MNTNPALTVTEMKERKTFLPLKNSLTTMTTQWMQLYYLSSLQLQLHLYLM